MIDLEKAGIWQPTKKIEMINKERMFITQRDDIQETPKTLTVKKTEYPNLFLISDGKTETVKVGQFLEGTYYKVGTSIKEETGTTTSKYQYVG